MVSCIGHLQVSHPLERVRLVDEGDVFRMIDELLGVRRKTTVTVADLYPSHN